MTKLRVLSQVVPTILLAACSATERRDSDAETVDFRALGRYIAKTNVFWDFGDYLETMADGTFEYDDVIRQPHVPAGPIEVDCENSHRVGAILVLYGFYEPKRNAFRHDVSIHSKKVRVTYTWSHTGNSVTRGRYETYVHPLGNGVVSDGLTLTRKDRVNGILSLKVKHKHKVVYETSFKLTGCEDHN